MKENYDVVIVGGGPSGIAAAISAGRQGADTLLIERYGFLGGMSTAALVYPWFTFHDMTGRQVIGGIAQEIVERLMSIGASPGHLRDTVGFVYSITPYDKEAFKLLALEMLQEANVDILLHSLVHKIDMDKQLITGFHTIGKYGRTSGRASIFIDTTGDADLAAMSGAPVVKGRTEDGKVQAFTLIFRLGGVKTEPIVQYIKDHPEDFHHQTLVDELDDMPLTAVSGFFSLWKKAPKSIPRDRVLFFTGPKPGEVGVNTTRIIDVDPTDPIEVTKAEIEGRRQVVDLIKFLQEEIPGFEDSYLIEMAPQIGVRESRRIVGEYVLTEDDVVKSRKFEDVIARCGAPIDIHVPGGTGLDLTDVDAAYDIPYRVMLPQKVDNLLVSGRAVSSSHVAFASLRVTAPVMALGQAAGTAAALAAINQTTPKDIDIKKLQEILGKNGTILN